MSEDAISHVQPSGAFGGLQLPRSSECKPSPQNKPHQENRPFARSDSTMRDNKGLVLRH